MPCQTAELASTLRHENLGKQHEQHEQVTRSLSCRLQRGAGAAGQALDSSSAQRAACDAATWRGGGMGQGVFEACV